MEKAGRSGAVAGGKERKPIAKVGEKEPTARSAEKEPITKFA